MHGGKCSKGQVQAWALNRYYYQAMIPIKDASLIARCEDPAIAPRMAQSRLVDHDGEREGEGGIARWLKLTDGLGLDRDYVDLAARAVAGDEVCRRCLCAFRAREDAAGGDRLLADRAVLAGNHRRAHGRHAQELRLRHRARRSPISRSARRRPSAIRDFALDYVKQHARTAETQQQVLAALEFKCDVLWAMLDALYHAYVAPRQVPPGAFVPQDQERA